MSKTKEELTKKLSFAVKTNDIGLLTELLDQDPLLINQPINSRDTPLFYCVFYEQYDMVKLLIQRGADLNKASGDYSPTPLERSMDLESFEIAKLLIAAGAKFEPKDGAKMLFTAIKNNQLDLAAMLLEKGIDPNSQDVLGRSMLHIAVGTKSAASLLFAIKYHVKYDLTNEKGKTALELAKEQGSVELEELLTNYTAVSQSRIEELNNKTPELISAIENFQFAEIKKIVKDYPELLKSNIFIGNNPTLQFLIAKNQYHIAEYLINKGIELNAVSSYGSTALTEAIEQNQFPIADLLIKKGATYDITKIIWRAIATHKIDLLVQLLNNEDMSNKLIASCKDLMELYTVKFFTDDDQFIMKLLENKVLAPKLTKSISMRLDFELLKSLKTNDGKLDQTSQKIYDECSKYGYKFPGFEPSLLNEAKNINNQLIEQILQNVHTDFDNKEVKIELTSLLTEGLEIVLKHQHISDIFKLAVNNNIKSFIYGGHRDSGSTGQYNTLTKTININNRTLDKVESLLKIKKQFGEKSPEYIDQKFADMIELIGAFTHENTHAAMDMLFHNNTEMFEENDVQNKLIVDNLLSDILSKKTHIFDMLPSYYSSTKHSLELPSFLYQAIAEELVRKTHITTENNADDLTFKQDILKCQSLVQFCANLFQEQCHGGQPLDSSSYNFNDSTDIPLSGESINYEGLSK